MEIYLLRHGAAERSSPGGRDADRKLTHEGIAAITSVIQQALHAGMNPSLILSSPYTRTMETARIAATLLAYREDIRNPIRKTAGRKYECSTIAHRSWP
jgi:phosphohistidine phosphatase SixA